MYFMIAACIAEMASAIPTSAGVYHWASVTAGAKYGRVVSFYAGWYALLLQLSSHLQTLKVTFTDRHVKPGGTSSAGSSAPHPYRPSSPTK
jgi:amino acid transporter